MTGAPIPFQGETLHGPAPRPAVIADPRVVTFDGNDAYAWTQTCEDIRNGDVLVVPGVAIGVMVEAWPVLVSGDGEATGFHKLAADADITALGADRWGRLFTVNIHPRDAAPFPEEQYMPLRGGADYSASFALAAELAAPAAPADDADDADDDSPEAWAAFDAAPAIQRVTIVGPNLPRQAQATFHVHAEGCADLKRGWIKDYAPDGWTIEATSLTDVCDEVYPPEDFECESGAYLYDFHIAPCVTLPVSS